MKVVIEAKMSGTGSIHDIASEHGSRTIRGGGKYAVVLAAYYGGRGYTTHLTEGAAIKQAERLAKAGYSFAIIDSEGNQLSVCRDRIPEGRLVLVG